MSVHFWYNSNFIVADIIITTAQFISGPKKKSFIHFQIYKSIGFMVYFRHFSFEIFLWCIVADIITTAQFISGPKKMF